MKWRSRASSSLFPPNWPCKCQTGCEKTVWTPPSISVSHLLFLFITAHSFAPSISANLRQNSSQSPGLHSAIPWAFSMLYYHLISLFFCHSSPLYYLFSYLMKDRENPPKQNEFDTCDVYGYGWPHRIFLFNRAFCLFCNFFFFLDLWGHSHFFWQKWRKT